MNGENNEAVKQLDGNNSQDKPIRKRKTKEEQIITLKAKKAIFLEKAAQADAKIQKLSLTPAEKKAAKKNAEDNCKIIAGVTSFELAKKGKPFFTLENFKNRLYAELTQPLEISFLNRQFKKTENK